MACTDDSLWDGGGFVSAGNCVTWDSLIGLRTSYNSVYDLLSIEGRQTGHKYGDAPLKEEIEGLATIQGFFSVKLDQSQTVQEIYFKITGGDILTRLASIGTNYTYKGSPYGDWIVYLKDPCFGCTGFKLDASNNPYARSVRCNNTEVANIDDPTWRGQCIWKRSGSCPVGALADGASICNLNEDWRDATEAKDKFESFAQDMAHIYENCYDVSATCELDPIPFCCAGSVQAVGHLTEEGTPAFDCGTVVPAVLGSSGASGSVYRWVKWVDIGQNGSLGQDSSSAWSPKKM